MAVLKFLYLISGTCFNVAVAALLVKCLGIEQVVHSHRSGIVIIIVEPQILLCLLDRAISYPYLAVGFRKVVPRFFFFLTPTRGSNAKHKNIIYYGLSEFRPLPGDSHVAP